MSNYSRNVRADIWDTRRFAEYSAKQKLFWFYLHTSDATSDTSVFRLRLSRASDACGIGKSEAKKILDGFIEEGLVVYDSETEEVCITDYFVYGHEPLSGIGYTYYRKDLKKIELQKILDALKEKAKEVEICEPFYRALSEVIPGLNCADYHIRSPKKTDKDKSNSQATTLDEKTDKEESNSKIAQLDAEENDLF